MASESTPFSESLTAYKGYSELQDSLFFELVRVASGVSRSLSREPTAAEWDALYRMARRHGILGVLSDGINRLPQHQRPAKKLLFAWLLAAENIVKGNRLVDARLARHLGLLAERGFACCLLKGQGLGAYYPDPSLRTPGDLDLWVAAHRTRVIRFVRGRFPGVPVVYHHVEYPADRNIRIELHFTPTWMFDYFSNRRLQRFFSREARRHFSNRAVLADGTEIACPTADFNCVYLLVHLYRHLFSERISLKQLMDYHMMLRSAVLMQSERLSIVAIIRKLHLMRFCRAVMYVLQEIFELEDEYLLVPPDSRVGAFLVGEMMRNSESAGSALHRTVGRLRRNIELTKYYPHEVLWRPVFKCWQYVWRLRNDYL